ncbi:MAG: hypothetical protein MI750_03795 [Xanthomonadales bacterium]|nr:hypothetical protein [Xanthomonadales bacterium]
MRIVEREGTGIGSVLCCSLKASVLALAMTTLGTQSAQATNVTVAVDGCDSISVGAALGSDLYVGSAPIESAYAMVGLSLFGDDTNGAGEGTGGEDTNSAGEGTGESTNSAGEGTGDATNSAGEGTGAPEPDYSATDNNYWGWAEISINTTTDLADIIIHEQTGETLTEYQVFADIAVSGLASGNGCGWN